MKEEKNITEAPTTNSERTTIVGKIGDYVTMEIDNLPKDFSFAYTFFRNIEQNTYNP